MITSQLVKSKRLGLTIFHRPIYLILRKSLENLSRWVCDYKIKNLSIQIIGCGLEGHKWRIVIKISLIAIGNNRIHVTFYHLERFALIEMLMNIWWFGFIFLGVCLRITRCTFALTSVISVQFAVMQAEGITLPMGIWGLSFTIISI